MSVCHLRLVRVLSRSHPRMMQPSSALLLACSHVLRASSESTVPPYRPSGPVLEAVTQVLTTKLALDSNWYGVPDEKELCSAFKSVVVETWDEDCCIVLVRGWAEELFEYEDIR